MWFWNCLQCNNLVGGGCLNFVGFKHVYESYRMKPYKSSKYTKLMWNCNYAILLNALKLINEGNIWILSYAHRMICLEYSSKRKEHNIPIRTLVIKKKVPNMMYIFIKHSMIRNLIMNCVISVKFIMLLQNLVDHLTKGIVRDLVHKSVIGMSLKYMSKGITYMIVKYSRTSESLDLTFIRSRMDWDTRFDNGDQQEAETPKYNVQEFKQSTRKPSISTKSNQIQQLELIKASLEAKAASRELVSPIQRAYPQQKENTREHLQQQKGTPNTRTFASPKETPNRTKAGEYDRGKMVQGQEKHKKWTCAASEISGSLV
ncbi:hypothetical protein LXL04_002814 [Taraxacum kok-saghyz]